MDYKFAGDFSKAPLGTFTEANKKLVWPGLSYDADKTGKYYEIVEDSRFPGGRACRMKYPKGGVGMNDQFYQVRIKSPQTIANLEFLWLFEDNFSFMTPNANKTCGGKIGPCINWGEVGGETSKRGTRAMMWWNGSGSNYPNPPDTGCPVFSPSCQDQRSGNQLVQPVKYSAKLVRNQVYKFRIQLKGGPGGQAKYWLDDTLLADTGVKDMMATATDDVLYDFAFFSGGATHPDNEPQWDSFARHGGIRYWSGSEYWAADDSGGGDGGNGGGGSGGGGNGSGPTLPAGGLTIDIDGTLYKTGDAVPLVKA